MTTNATHLQTPRKWELLIMPDLTPFFFFPPFDEKEERNHDGPSKKKDVRVLDEL